MQTVDKIVKLDSLQAYADLYGLSLVHPLAAVIDLKEAKRIVNHIAIDYGVYALYLKNGVNCTLKYGRKQFDCQNGTIVSFSPGQTVSVDMEQDELAPDVVGLMFHPDLVYGTPLADIIDSYTFFDYSQWESLHLSEEERNVFLDCLERIRRETEHPVDSHTPALISSHIQVLLNYLKRFYERQFATRSSVNTGVVRDFEQSLREYYRSGAGRDGVPTVAYFASRANLTSGYFGDLVKKETGITAREFIAGYIVKRAKQRLVTTDDDVSVIAYDLGFQYPQHFTRLFKRVAGQSPSAFRRSMDR